MKDETKLLKRIIQAQARLLISYRLGSKPPEWVFDVLEKGTAVFGNLNKITSNPKG